MNAPLVSIIVPAYNAGPWLQETLESALVQTWKPTEIIVVDDGSTDDTAAIAGRYGSRGVRLHSQANRGLSGARNAGLGLARGDFIQFLDADDLLAPEKIERQVRALAAAPPRTLGTGRWARFRMDSTQARFKASPFWRDLDPDAYLGMVARSGNSIPVHAWLLPRGITDAIGPFAEQLKVMEDQEYFARAVLASAGLRFCADADCLYRSFHARTLSKLRDEGATRSIFEACQLVANHLLAAPSSAARRQAAADYYQVLVYRLYPDRPDLVGVAERQVAELGGSNVKPAMGRRGQALARIVGWKAVQRVRSWLWSKDIYLGRDQFVAD